MIFLCFIWFMSSFCADNQNPITDYHEHVAHNTLQLQTSDSRILRQLAIERNILLAQANGQYIAGTIVYQSYKLTREDKEKLIKDLEISRARIRTNPDLQQAVFEPVQTLLNMHIKLLPELYAHKVAFDHARKENMRHMTKSEIKQCTDMWQQLDEELKMVYVTTFESWLYQSEEALKEDVSKHDLTIS